MSGSKITSGKLRRCGRCGRCGRRLRSIAAAEDWNAIVERGIITTLVCPGCQTLLENAEAMVNETTLDYGVLDCGRLIGRPKTGGAW